MKDISDQFPVDLVIQAVLGALIVGGMTLGFLLIGRQVLGEAVIALIYLVPVVFSSYRWGQVPGTITALVAALCFDFFFIPPFYKLTVGNLEGWLVLAIFFAVSIFAVGSIQAVLSRAQANELEAISMYELSSQLVIARTYETVAQKVALFILDRYLTSRVQVSIQPKGQAGGITFSEPVNGKITARPDRTIPIINSWGFVGEILIWEGRIALPKEESRLFRDFSFQIGLTMERIYLVEIESRLAIATNTSAD